jgi:hypothetical protein
MKSGASLAAGTGLGYHGQSWGYGPVFPLLIAGITWVTPDQEAAYELVKALNALAFAAAAVPVYLLGRRVLRPWWSVAAAAAAVVIPSSAYVAVVMTESVAYLLAVTALLAVVRALERPTPGRQLAAVGAAAAAVAARPQIAAIYVAYVLGLAAVLALAPAWRERARRAPLFLWPTALSLLAGVAWLVRPLLQGKPFGASLGSYSVLARSYEPLRVLQWFVYHVGDIALYVAVVPVAVAPVALAAWWRRGRGGSSAHLALAAAFAAQNLVGIGLVAGFASTPYGLGLLYDRYLFYLVPLWLVVLAWWLQEGLPRPRALLAAGAAAAVVSIAVLPYGVVATDDWFAQFEGVATEVWGKVGRLSAHLPVDSPRALGILFALAVAAGTAFVPRRRAWALAGAVALVMGANLALAWRSAFVDANDFGTGPVGTRAWVDDRVGAHAHVTVLYVARACRPHPERVSGFMTDFFNRSVDATATFGGEGGSAPDALRLRPDGTLVDGSGTPLRAEYVVTQPNIGLAGTRLATGMPTRLELWRTGGDVRVTGVRTRAALLATPCAPSPAT